MKNLYRYNYINEVVQRAIIITVLQSKFGPKLESKLSRIDLFKTRQSQIIMISILRAWLVFSGKS